MKLRTVVTGIVLLSLSACSDDAARESHRAGSRSADSASSSSALPSTSPGEKEKSTTTSTLPAEEVRAAATVNDVALLPSGAKVFSVLLRDTGAKNKAEVGTRLVIESSEKNDRGEITQVQRLDTTEASERTRFLVNSHGLFTTGWSYSGGQRAERCDWEEPLLVLDPTKARSTWTSTSECPGQGDLRGSTITGTLTVTLRGDGVEHTSEGEAVDVWQFTENESLVVSNAGVELARYESSIDGSFAPRLGLIVHSLRKTRETSTGKVRTYERELRLRRTQPNA